MYNVKKVLLSVLLIMALLLGTVPAFAEAVPAASSVTTIKLGFVIVSSQKYTGKKLTPAVKVYDENGKRVAEENYKVKVGGFAKNAGKYPVKVTGKGIYTGTVSGTFVIKKIKNPFEIKAGKTEFKYKKSKQQSTWIKLKGRKGGAELGAWKSSAKKVYVDEGRLYIAAGFEGKAKLSITTMATTNYKRTTKSITITVAKKQK